MNVPGHAERGGIRRALPLAALILGVMALPPVSPGLEQPEPGKPLTGMAKLEIKPGDHISIIGNTLADRMQHDGWLEAYLHARFPKQDLVFRNLGFSGDELTIRLRSANFGSPDDWLSRTKTDVVFAFFGYNESFAGEKGLSKFRKDLDSFIKNTLAKKYNGQGAPRLVIFSPIAHENLHDPNLPDGAANNKRLALYTTAMSEVAAANNVPFVDLFHPSVDLYAKAKKPLTINGIHLNAHGNQQIAAVIDEALFGMAPKHDAAHLEKIRKAVLDKNFFWFNRYRTVDGYSIFGERAFLKFVNGQTNLEVMQREMQILDVMTANRDKACWAATQGKPFTVDDSNTPPFIPVISNKPGLLPGGKHVFRPADMSLNRMTVGKNLKVNVFASEKDWPELVNPVAMAWDTKGRLWVACWHTYPHWKPKSAMDDKLIILEDTKGTGRADKMTIFADGLHCPTGFTFYNGGVLVAQAPGLVYLKDSKGGDHADIKVRVLDGLDSADTHHTANSFVTDPGGAVYFQEGTFHHTQVETPYGPSERCANAGVFRYEPRTQKFEVYVAHHFANPHGHSFDRWGQDIVTDGTGSQPYHAALFSGQIDFPHAHNHPPQVYKQKTRPCPGTEFLSSRHFPDEMQGNFLVANVIGFQGILRYKIKDKGASFQGIEMEPIVSSPDPNFRPADIKIGPDGAIYFCDWHNPIIGHMQHNLRDPSRDTEHGRIYRVIYEGRPLLKPHKIHGQPLDKLLDLLKEPEDSVRSWARSELAGRPTKDVMTAVQKWLIALDKNDANYEHNLLEALWLHQSHNIVNEGLLQRMLKSPDFHARAAATRVLCYWRDRVPQPLKLLQVQINDPHPRVRLEAIRALSFFNNQEALNISLELLAHPEDEFLRFTFNETLNTLERRLGGDKVNRDNIAASLLKMLEKGKIPPDREPLLIETITHHGGEKELTALWTGVNKGSYPPALQQSLLGWLADAALTRKATPKFTADEVGKLLSANDSKQDMLAAAIRLTTAWKVKDLAPQLEKIARFGKYKLETRLAAIDSLAAFGDPASMKALKSLAGPPNPMALRFHASVALAQLNLDAGASSAAAAIAGSKSATDFGPVVEGFLGRKNGAKKLAEALEQVQLSADAAKQVLKAMYLAGHNDPELSAVISKAAGLGAAPKIPTAAEITELVTLAKAKGDPSRGELVFRRADLGCMKCHAINKAGGHIGPDLGPIGRDSPMDYVVQSILDPNASIKEEYLTKLVVTGNGKIYQGIEVERTKNLLVLKDATGKLQKIPTADIDQESKGKSLMPEGVTQILTKDELLDLISFVSILGKEKFAAPKSPTILRWNLLQKVPPTLLKNVPNRDELRDQILSAAPEKWQPVFAQVNGTLPLGDLTKPGVNVVYLQGEINVMQAGPVEVLLSTPEPATFWIDEDAFENQPKATVELSPGRHKVTVRVLLPSAVKGPTLQVQILRPADSKANYEIVHGE